MKTYEAHKDSGIEWIGDIPEHWEVKKLKYDNQLIMGQSPNSSDCNTNDIGIPFLQGNAEFGVIHPIEKNWCSIPKKTTNVNDVLLSVRAPVGAVNIANKVFGIGRGLCAIRNNNFKYLYYLCLKLNEEFESLSTGSTFKAISTEQIKNVQIPIPKQKEQTKIANYLDKKIAEIDELIAQKKKLLNLYEKEKAVIIDQAVTKGINPDVELKDSGIEWIGDIPEHWDSIRLKYIGNLYGGLSGKSSEDFKQDINSNNKPFIPFTNIANNKIIDPKQLQYVVIGENEKQNKVSKGDLFFMMSSENIEDVGKSTVLLDDLGETYLNSFCKGFHFTNENFSSRFINYLLLSKAYRSIVQIEANGFTRINLKIDKINDIPIKYPLLNEQTKIANYLDKKTAEINTKSKKTKNLITLLKEYKTALISEVVTGKIKVN